VASSGVSHDASAGGRRTEAAAPPVTDPIDPNVDPIIWREAALLGAAMTPELERDRHIGVSRTACSTTGRDTRTRRRSATTSFALTEAASVKIATPVTQPAPDPRGRVSARIRGPADAGRFATSSITT
jgi:hypothetical protein